MKASKLLLPLIICFLLIEAAVPVVAFAASHTTKNYSFSVIENDFGVPFTVTGTEWLSINGYTTSQSLAVNYFAISGVLRNYEGYPFDMAQLFTSGELYETSLSGSGIKRGTVSASQVQRFDFFYDPSDQPWSVYGETSNISIPLLLQPRYDGLKIHVHTHC